MLDDEALWREFAAESEEHLDAIERLLTAPQDPGAVDGLFRAFHSLKGMSAALGAPGMQAVAHRCEDILGLARQGRATVVGLVTDELLAAVDVLRRQRTAVLERRTDAPAPAALLFRLAALAETISDTKTFKGSATPGPLGAGRDAASPLLSAFAAALRQAAPGLAELVRPPEAATASGAAMATELAGHARALGLARVAEQLARLAAAAGGPAALPMLGGLRRQMEALAEATGEVAGAAVLANALTADAGGVLRPMLAALAVCLQDLAAGAAPDGSAAATAARVAGEVAAALGHTALEALLLLAEDLADRVAEPDAAALLAAEVPALVEHLRLCAEEGDAAIRALPALAEPTGEAMAGPLRLPRELARLLGPAGRRRVQEALAFGNRIYRARLGLPASAKEEQAVQVWLSAQGAEALTSRTLLDTTPPTLDLLFTAPADLEALEAARAAFDPAGRLVQALSALRAEAAPAEGAVATTVRAGVPGATMRVRQETIDGIITLEAEVRAAALAMGEALQDGAARDLPTALGALARRLSGGAARELATLADVLRQLQEQMGDAEARLSLGLRRLDEAVLELRVVPIGTLFARLPRVVRSVSQASGKEVELVLEGQEVSIDRSLVELLADPLLHLVRNAVDHGVESPEARQAAGKPGRATLRVRARRRTGQVRVEVSDDGRGIDRAAVLRVAFARGLVTAVEAGAMDDAAAHALLFRAGFSTSERVSETSGRGVGLDVVQDAMRRAGGAVEVSSAPGQGTTFTLTMPLTAAMAPVLLVEVAGHPYALPATRVEAVVDGSDVAARAAGVVSLARFLGLPATDEVGGVVILRQTGGGRIALAVDQVRRRTDLLLRPPHPALSAMVAVGGVGMLGNGDLVIVLEPDGIAVA